MPEPPSLLITQCLQVDFVKPLCRGDELPNMLHVGYEESRRLLGEHPKSGPLALFFRWVQAQTKDSLRVVHIRDWHDKDDALHHKHLEHFGGHCLKDSVGARFVFEELLENGEDVGNESSIHQPYLVNSLALNDFQDTDLDNYLAKIICQGTRVGIIGVWTEAKVTFLAYELATRYPQVEVGVCSALTASSSTSHHFLALEQMKRLLGVKVYDSIGEFIDFLGGTGSAVDALPEVDGSGPLLKGSCAELPPTDKKLLSYLFRDCRAVEGSICDGGYSGNVVISTKSWDLHGHEQAAHVVKIGPRESIGRERSSFERIEGVLGNCAPRISVFADFENRGALKYRYASMGAGASTTFQRLYQSGLPLEEEKRILHTVFEEQLGRLYAAKTRESIDLLDYYCFSPEWAPGARRFTTEIAQNGRCGPSSPHLEPGKDPLYPAHLALQWGREEVPNLCYFYETSLALLPRKVGRAHFVSFVHGDLNGANIIIDSHRNVWLIDFFHTHRGHILKDLTKLENDVLYIFTKINSEQELSQCCDFTDALLELEDLCLPLPELPQGVCSPQLSRAWETVRSLRSFFPGLVETDRGALQFRIAQLRYAVHTLSFDECSAWQKKWALYAASRLSALVTAEIQGISALRISWLSPIEPGVGLTILPGRRDYKRSLTTDIEALKHQGVDAVVCLVPDDELRDYGVPNLTLQYNEAGLLFLHSPIMDQSICSLKEMDSIVSWVSSQVEQGKKVAVHCVGGLGRAGTVAACFLKKRGLSTEAAIDLVRMVRSSRAIETDRQEEFISRFDPACFS